MAVLNARNLSDIWEHILINKLTQKTNMKCFSDTSASFETSADLSFRAYFQQITDWYERHVGDPKE